MKSPSTTLNVLAAVTAAAASAAHLLAGKPELGGVWMALSLCWVGFSLKGSR